jgi:hypothetical protein
LNIINQKFIYFYHFLDETQNEIEIKNLSKIDSGKYECKLFNSLGFGSDTIIIQVQCKKSF